MSEKPANQASNSAMYSSYAPGRMPYNGTGYQALGGQAFNMSAQIPLNNLQALKASLPISNHTNAEAGLMSRPPVYNNQLMVLSTGQTVPFNSFYGQNTTSPTESLGQLPYLPSGLMPNLIRNTNLQPGTVPNYQWPYGIPDVSGLDAARRTSWSSNEDTVNTINNVGNPGQLDYYAGLPFYPAHSNYVIGPIQPMKCADNKSYEMVNLDELVLRDPPMPRAVPALWTNQEELSLAKCLQNPEGITNVYIRGFMPDTEDHHLEGWASRFGEIESCKAIVDTETGKCKGFGFVMYYSPAAAENCIRGFFHLGFQASYAQKSRNSRLKDLEDKSSTNIYCTGVPLNWNESDLAKHFLPFNAISTKICRDAPSGVSKEVGFARFESREIAERVIKDFHGVEVKHDIVKLSLRFADTKAQKQLKQQSQERRNWRSREYSYSVEHTPSPVLPRLQNVSTQVTPNESNQSPAGTNNAFTPATSVSPPEIPGFNKGIPTSRNNVWPMHGGLQSITNTSAVRSHVNPMMATARHFVDVPSKVGTSVSGIAEISTLRKTAKTPSPKKVTIKIEPASGKENVTGTPRSMG